MRFLGYFFLVFVALFVLRELPILGGLFRIPLIGFFLAAAVVSAFVARGGEFLARRAKLNLQLRDLGTVDTPQMRGKLGRLLLLSGRARQAVEPLREASAADPDNTEWQYRLGCALSKSGAAQAALVSLGRAVELQADYAYGSALLELSGAALAVGQPDLALESLERFHRSHGPSAEWAYRKGVTLKAVGRVKEARAAFRSTAKLARQAAKYQKAEAREWAARGLWARFF